MEGLFDLQTPEQLLRKLEWEYEQWRIDPLNTYRAWNFFVTAEHLPDWLARSGPRLPKGFGINDFKQGEPLLRICSHIANGGKHFSTRPEQHKSVDRTVREMTGYVEDGYIQDGYYTEEPALRVYLTLDEQQALKRTSADVDALWLATWVLEFWRQFPGVPGIP